MDPIPLRALLGDGLDPKLCKVHCAVWNGEQHPIDVLGSDPDGWQGWNSYRSNKNDFNRPFIFSLAQDRHDPTLWLFGGVWEVLERRPVPYSRSYTVALRDDLMGPYIRRLYVRLRVNSRQVRRKMESVLDLMTVASILEEPYAGAPFPGHGRINHTLADLQLVVRQNRADWRLPLEPMKGVYVIHDQLTGARYVGSACGDTGIWARWSEYAKNLHGGNRGLIDLLAAKGDEYFRQNLRFALLEFWSMRTDDALVLERESYWKDVLQARTLGHNRN